MTEIGDQDIDVLEMKMYDMYRQDDGEPYSYDYLIQCREILINKLESCSKRCRNNLNEGGTAQGRS